MRHRKSFNKDIEKKVNEIKRLNKVLEELVRERANAKDEINVEIRVSKWHRRLTQLDQLVSERQSRLY